MPANTSSTPTIESGTDHEPPQQNSTPVAAGAATGSENTTPVGAAADFTLSTADGHRPALHRANSPGNPGHAVSDTAPRPSLSAPLTDVLEWVHVVDCDDPAAFFQQLRCQLCDTTLAEIERDDSLVALAQTALSHMSRCDRWPDHSTYPRPLNPDNATP